MVRYVREAKRMFCSVSCAVRNRPPKRSMPDRFWSKVEKGDGCWIWHGARGEKGYGSFSFNGRVTPAHRVAWMLTNGPIENGLHILHRCDTPSCMNPSHLFQGTNTDNVHDMIAKGRNRRKLTDDQVRQVVRDTRSNVDIAADYGVTRQAIRYIKARDARATV